MCFTLHDIFPIIIFMASTTNILVDKSLSIPTALLLPLVFMGLKLKLENDPILGSKHYGLKSICANFQTIMRINCHIIKLFLWNYV